MRPPNEFHAMPPLDHSASWTFSSNSEEETRRFGGVLGQLLEPGSVVALIGDLGAGKTRLVQGICRGAEVQGQLVNSPTFALIQEYEGRLPIYHFDAYRLRSPDEFLELGAEEYLAGEGVCLIEWADRVAEVLLPDLLTVRIEVSGPESRLFKLSASGPRSNALLTRVREETALS